MKFLLCVVGLGLCWSSLAAEEVSAEAKECFEWFATLGHPDPKDATWAEIGTGVYYYEDGDQPKRVTSPGFLLGGEGDKFHVLFPDLTERTFTKTGHGAKAYEKVGAEPRDFVEMVKGLLGELQAPPESRKSRFRAKLGHKAETFHYAYICWRKGEFVLAQQLYDEASKLECSFIRDQRASKPAMREALEIELGHAAMWDAVLHAGGSSLGGEMWARDEELVSRGKLLEMFRRIIRLYPHSVQIDRAKASVAILEKMVKEDAAHAFVSRDDLAKLPVDRQVSELIFQLRDQNGHQSSQPGWCDIFEMNAEEESPAHQLVKLGTAAVPQLVDVLGDDRFSRSVGFHRNFHFSHTILTVGDCAEAILSRIARKNFYTPRSTSSYMSRDDDVAATKKEVREWWEGFQRKGEKQSLIDDIASGEVDPGPLYVRLRELDAAAADRAVLDGVVKVQEPWLVRRFIDVLANVKGDAATKQLLARARGDGDLNVRLSAMTCLLNDDHPEALPLVIEQWRRLGRADSNGIRDGVEVTIRLLVACGNTVAMQELVKEWDLRPIYERFEIVSILGELLHADANDDFNSIRLKPQEVEARDIAIRLLAHALEDSAIRAGSTGGRGNFNYSNPRICDFALWALNRMDPKTYAFSPKASRRTRDRERFIAANIWRHEHGSALLAVPEIKALPKLAESEALQISLVTIEGGELIAGTAFAQQVNALKGARLVPETVPNLLVQFASQRIEGVGGLTIDALRESDLTGVEIHVKVDAGSYPTTGSWGLHNTGKFSTIRLGSRSGSFSAEHGRPLESLQDFIDDVRKGLQSPPSTEFEFCIGIGEGSD